MSTTVSLEAAQVMQHFPHRYPFLMLDRVLELQSGVQARAVKNVSVNEPHFTGHFPGQPIMPGVLILEAMAQCGGLVFDIGSRLCVLARVDKARFLRSVRPGDQLILHGTALTARRDMGKASATASVDGRAIASAELTYSFIAEAPVD